MAVSVESVEFTVDRNTLPLFSRPNPSFQQRFDDASV